MPKTKQDILREFEEKFGKPVYAELTIAGLTNRYKANDEIKSFLSQALNELAGELVGAVPDVSEKNTSDFMGEKYWEDCCGAGEKSGFNEARSALLACCKEMGIEVK